MSATGTEFSHLDDKGAARMVDVSAKDVSARTATATGFVRLSAECVGLLRAGDMPKGDALSVARIAGIMGAKRVPDLVPLCHPIGLHGVTVELEIREGTNWLLVLAKRAGVDIYDSRRVAFLNMNHGPMDLVFKTWISSLFPRLAGHAVVRIFVLAAPFVMLLTARRARGNCESSWARSRLMKAAASPGGAGGGVWKRGVSASMAVVSSAVRNPSVRMRSKS